jgi:predicted  nucleic acid-binding Zn-ribbon protein
VSPLSDEARREIAAALAGDDGLAALRVLRAALDWSATVTARFRDRSEDPTAVEAVMLLDDALSTVGALTREVPGLLAAAELGPSVDRYLHDRMVELAELREQVARATAAHDELVRSEQELRARLAEHAKLQQKVASLRRLERLVRALEELRAQRGLLDERLAVLTQRTEGVEEAIGRGSRQLLRLTEEQRRLLAPRVREALEQATSAQAALADEEDRLERDRAALASATERFEQLRSTRDERVAGLAVYAKADRDLVQALAGLTGEAADADRPGLERALAIVDGVEDRLRTVDDLLARVLDARQRDLEQDRKRLGWSDGSARN